MLFNLVIVFIILIFVITNKDKDKHMFYTTEKIQIKYYGSEIKDLPYKHDEIINISFDNLAFKTTMVNNIITTVLSMGCQIMLETLQNKDIILIWIDNKHFKQR